MNRNRIAVAALIGLMVVGVAALSYQPVHRVAQVAHAIGGNATLEPAPSTYVVPCFPKNWKSDTASQAMLSELGKIKNRSRCAVQTYVDGDPDFEHRWQSDSNSGPISPGKLPSLVVMHNNEKVYCASGDSILGSAGRIDKILDRLPCHPKPKPEPKPEPEPAPDDRPVVPDTPDTVEPEPAVAEETNPALVVLSMIVGGFIGWAFMFSRKVRG